MKLLSTCLSICASLPLYAQITLNNSTFPAANDVLQISRVDNIADFPLSAAAPTAQTWDFRGIITQAYQEDTVQAASLGAAFAQFPTADIIAPFSTQFGGTAYIDVTSTEVNRIGAGIEAFGFSFVAPFSNPQTVQSAPLAFNALNTDSYDVSFAVNIDSVPFLRQLIDSLVTGLPIRPDSLRIKIAGNATRHVDAYGTCRMPDADYDVLRVHLVDYLSTRIEARVPSPFGGGGVWFDVSSFVTGALPFPTTDTVNTYEYWANNSKQPMVRYNMNNDESQIESMEFKGENYTPNAVRETMLIPAVEIYPNPAVQRICLRWVGQINQNFEPYSIQIFDMSGRVVLAKLLPQTLTSVWVDIPGLAQGTYTCVLWNKEGRRIAQQRFVVQP